MPSATHLSLPHGDVAVDVVAGVAASLKGAAQTAWTEQATPLAESRDYAGLAALAADQLAALLADEAVSDQDLDGVFVLVCHLLPSQPDRAVVDRLVAVAAGSTADRVQLRLQLLAQLYNLVGGSEAVQGEVFRAVVQYAADTAQVQLLAAHLQTLGDLDEPLLRVVHGAFAAAGMADEAQAAGLRLLRLYDTQGEPAAVADVAVACVAAALKAPVTSATVRDELVQVRAVAALASDAAHKGLFDLLSALSTGSFADFQAQLDSAAGQAAAQQHGLDAAALTLKMRLLTLAAVASAKQSLTYDEIAAALQVDAGEVEQWVVRAVTHDLLQARMDQETRTVVVKRCAHSNFGDPEAWATLQTRLHGWRDNVAGILELVRASRQA